MKVGPHNVANDAPLTIIAGPCQIEDERHALYMAQSLAKICKQVGGVKLVYKSSYDKANRTSLESPRGVGIGDGLRILQAVKRTFKLPVTTDVHTPEEAGRAAHFGTGVDLIQIPAFLSRQTDLLVAAGDTGKPVNIKKGQWMHPVQIIHATEKVRKDAVDVMVTERGTFFGYERLVVDYATFPKLKGWCPVCFDATHSVQQFGGSTTGGARDLILPLAKSAVAQGIAALFVEVHDEPDNAPSDGLNMLKLDDFRAFLTEVMELDRHVKGY